MNYTIESVKAAVEANEERLFAPWKIGRAESWTTDSRTKALICLGFWLREELTKLGASEDDRRTQEALFHRWSRSDEDLYELSAYILNETLAGRVQQNRKPHRRWG